jgi:opacity protein-like surface antigen
VTIDHRLACSLVALLALAAAGASRAAAQPVPAGQGAPAQPAQEQPAQEQPAVPRQPAQPDPQPPGTEARPERPYRGIFAGANGALQPPGLSLLLDGYGGRDTNVLASQHGGGQNPFAGVAGEFVGGSAALNYLWTRRQSLFAANAFADVRDYPKLDVPMFQSYSGSVNGQFPLGSRFTVDLRQDVMHSSFYQLDFGPRAGVAPSEQPVARPASSDRGLSESATYGFVSAASVTQTLSPRSTLEYSYTRRQTHYERDGHEFLMNRGDVAFRRGMTRYATLRLGYGYQKADYGSAVPTEIQNIDVGVDYARPLSFSRRTRVGFSIGSSVLTRESVNFYRVGGTADVTHEIGRTWALVGAYQRGLQVTDIVPQPLYTDTVTASATGMASRRLDLSFDARYSTGQLTLSSHGRGIQTYGASSTLEYALSERLALYGTYAFYHYSIGQRVDVPIDVPRDVDRHSVRGGVRLWVPLLTHRERGNASGLR